MSKFTSRLNGKKALIIGGTSGIGFATAEGVLAYGGAVIISSSNPSNLNKALERLTSIYPDASDRIHGKTCDFLGSASLDTNVVALLEFAQQAGSPGPIHHIVFTAGNRNKIPPMNEASLEVLQRLAAVRYVGPVFLAKHAPRYMVSGPEASITLTTNAGEEKPIKGWGLSVGATSIMGLARGMAVDLAPLRTNLVKLGFVQTELLKSIASMGAKDEQEAEQKLKGLLQSKGASLLTGKVGLPESVAEAYLYFMKDQNVTGQSITTDGGHTLV